ncbi:MAG: hypothetical protein ACKV2Q_01575 [Planctomycetaceae bacterium]
MSASNPLSDDDCPLSAAQQGRNIFCFAGFWCLFYLAAPVTYVGLPHANLLKQLLVVPLILMAGITGAVALAIWLKLSANVVTGVVIAHGAVLGMSNGVLLGCMSAFDFFLREFAGFGFSSEGGAASGL